MVTDNVCNLIDDNLAYLIHTVIVIMKIAIPVILIILGMLDFGKGVIASKEDEIKKGQQIFIKRLISAFLVFFVVTIVQTLIVLIDDKNDIDESDAWTCANMILNGEKKDKPQENNENQKEKFEANNGTKCNTKTAVEDYNICIQTNTSERDTNKKVCGTIFESVCENEYETLWKTNEKYKDEVVNELDWYKSDIIRNIEIVKQTYYNCVESGLQKELCAGYFKGFYEK
jgi:hypothetical protein